MKDIVLLHGWGIHSGIWQCLASQLKKPYRITTIDLPGYNDNPLIKGKDGLDDICQQILTAAPKKAIWLGWSMGGLIATQIAAKHPERVEKLILVANSPCFVEKENWPGIKNHIFQEFKNSLALDPPQALNRFLLLQLAPKNPREQLSQLTNILLQKEFPSISTLQNGLNLLSNYDLRSELANMKTPTLSILGEYDKLVPSKISSLLNTYLPQMQITVIPESGHIPFFTHTKLFYESLLGFLHV